MALFAKKYGIGLVVCLPGITTAAVPPVSPGVQARQARRVPLSAGERTSTGQFITPMAATGASFVPLYPDLPGMPGFTAGQAARLAISPDGNTLLVLTSGFNRNFGADGKPIALLSREYIFVYDISHGAPTKRQVLTPNNTFEGLVWAPDGKRFYVSGGMDDAVLEYVDGSEGFTAGRTFKLGHVQGLGLKAKPQTAGVAVSPNGKVLLAANYQNDSVTLIDLGSGAVLAEQDLRPVANDPGQSGLPGGSFPRALAWASDTEAYVGSQRDREIISLQVDGSRLSVGKRIAIKGQPASLILNKDRDRLYVAMDNTDGVAIVDTKRNTLVEEFVGVLPTGAIPLAKDLGGAGTNFLALSPDEHNLFLSNGGLNAISVVRLGDAALSPGVEAAQERASGHDGLDRSQVIGLIPTGWYPTGVSVSRDGRWLYAINGKSVPGPNLGNCRGTFGIVSADRGRCHVAGKYVWQLQKAGLLAMPMPGGHELEQLTRQVAQNDRFASVKAEATDTAMMSFLRAHIHHVIYVVKENRSYDQVLGDLGRGNGDPSLTLLAEPLSPNHHALARQFVTLDNFMDSGESSNTGWNWTTAGRTNDFVERESPVEYAGRGLQYDEEGTNRTINVGLATLAERKKANPDTPNDPGILPGTSDVAAPDGPNNAQGEGYIWNAAIRAGVSLRNYGFFGDLTRYYTPTSAIIPLDREPFQDKRQVFFTTKAALLPFTDIYYRGFDQGFPDYWRYKEWEREFDGYAASKTLPALSLVRLPHDHFGSFEKAIDKVNTVETEIADNDYALALLIHKVAQSRYAKDTLIFVVEDDAQDGADHVDAHRSIALVAGPYVRKSAVVSEPYNTVSMLKTIEMILGLQPMGLTDALARPMSAVFARTLKTQWSYQPIVPEVLRQTALPLPFEAGTRSASVTCGCPQRSQAYWASAMAGQNFNEEDHLDTARFNAALWQGLKHGSHPGCVAPSQTEVKGGRNGRR